MDPDHVVVIDFRQRAHPASTAAFDGEAAAQSFGVRAFTVDAPLPPTVVVQELAERGLVFGSTFTPFERP